MILLMLPDVLELDLGYDLGYKIPRRTNLRKIFDYRRILPFMLIHFASYRILGNNSSSGADYQPDRPIGYGAFGVVWSVTDPRDGKRVALKKLPNVFQSLVSSKRVFRELKMMIFFKHENVLSCLDILQVI